MVYRWSFLFDWWVHVTSWNAIHRMIESAQNSPVPDSLLCKGASGPRLAMTGRQLMFQDTKRHYRPCGSGLQWKQFKSHYRSSIKYRAPRKQNGPVVQGSRGHWGHFKTLSKSHFCVHLESNNKNFPEIGKYPETVMDSHCSWGWGVGVWSAI